MTAKKISYKEVVKSYETFNQQMIALVEQNNNIANAIHRKEKYDPDLCETQMNLCQEMMNNIEQASKIGEDGIAYPDLALVCVDGKLPDYVENVFNLRKFIEKYGQLWVNKERDFADIVVRGPHNAAEARLLEIATNTLEPHEFAEAVSSHLGPAEMEEKMETSRVTKLNQRLLAAHQLMRDAYSAETVRRAEKAHQVDDLSKQKDTIYIGMQKDFR